MAEINEDDLISAKALKAPYELAAGFDASVASLTKLITLLKQTGGALGGADDTAKVRKETEKLTAAEIELDKIKKQITATQAKNNETYIAEQKALAKVKDELKAKIALGNQEATQIKAQTSSLKELKSALDANRKAYADLSNEEARNSAEGKKLLATINEQDVAVKKANETQGKFQDSVGNYSKFNDVLGKVSPAAQAAANGIGSMTKAALAFIATPIGFFVAGLALVLGPIIGFLKGTGDGLDMVEEKSSGLKTGLAVLGDKFKSLGKDIIDGNVSVGGFAEGLGKVLKVLASPSSFTSVFTDLAVEIGAANEAGQEFARTMDDIGTARLFQAVQDEKEANAIKQLLIQAKNRTLSEQDRIKLLDEALAKEAALTTIHVKSAEAELAAISKVAEVRVKVAKEADDTEETYAMKQAERLDHTDEELRDSLLTAAKNLEVARGESIAIEEKALNLKDKLEDDAQKAKDKRDAEAASKAQRLEDAIYEIEKIGIERRISQSKEGTEQRFSADLALAELNGQHLLDNDKLLGKEREAIETQTAANVEAITIKYNQAKVKLQEDNIRQYIAQRQLELEVEIAVIKDNANKGLITREAADSAVLEAKKANGILLIQETLDQQLKILEIENLSAEERKKIEAEVEATKIKLIDATFEANKVKDVDEIAAAAKKLQTIQGIYQNFANAVKDIVSIGSQNRIAAIDAEEKALDEQTKKELEAAGDNQAAKDAIQKSADAKHAVLERRRIDELRKQAAFEKKQGIISAGIATALAVLNALSTVKPYPLAVIAAISAGIAGAAQIAAIASKPLPAYEKGTKSARGGLSLVGEAGMEMLKHNGHIGFTPEVPTIMNLQPGTEVIPHAETMQRLGAAAMVADGGRRGSREDAMLSKQLLNKLDKVNTSIQNIQFPDLISSGAIVFKSMRAAKDRSKIIKGFNMGKWL